jgi:hypothetical protein
MNEKQTREKSLIFGILEIVESLEKEEGTRKNEIRDGYRDKYESVSKPRVGGIVDILTEFGLISASEKSGLCKISPLGKRLLDRMRSEERPVTDLLQEVLSKGLNS